LRQALENSSLSEICACRSAFAGAGEALEDALYDSQALRGFAGIDLHHDPVPDAPTVLNFRHWLEQHKLTKVLFDEVGRMLGERGLLMRQGTIVDATIIAAPPATKNQSKSRDPEMHQTKKGNQWPFGMKAHIGVDVASGVVHTVTGTAANKADINQTAVLLHGREAAVFGPREGGDAGDTGADKRPELADRDVSWNIAIKRRIIKACPGESRGPCPKPCGIGPRRWSGRGRRCGPRSSIPSTWSRTGSAIRSCATAAWPRTPRNSTPCSPWPIWSSSRRPCLRNGRPDDSRSLPRSQNSIAAPKPNPKIDP